MSHCPRWTCARMALLWNCDSFLLNRALKSSYSQRMTPFFISFWKSGPMEWPVMSWIHSLSSSSFWGSYFWAIWVGGEVKGHVSQRGRRKIAHIHLVWSPFLTHDLGKLPFLYEFYPHEQKWEIKVEKQRFVDNLVCCLYIKFHSHSISIYYAFFNYLKTRAHTGISCLANCCSQSPLPLKYRKFVSETG